MALSLNFKAFIVRAHVLKLYRQALRTAHRAPIHARGEVKYLTGKFLFFFFGDLVLGGCKGLRAVAEFKKEFAAELRRTMRQEMEKNRHCDDKQKVRFLISEGLRRLKELDEMLHMQGHS